MNPDSFRYDGKRAVVVGGATGMGAATAELVQDLGAEVVVMDYADVTLPGVKAIKLDLRDKASIDAAVDECGGPIHALFSCRRRGRRHAGHREDQLHRPPPPHRPGDRHGLPRARLGHRHDLVDRRPGVGAQPRRRCSTTSPPRTSTPRRVDRGARADPSTRQRRLHVEQADASAPTWPARRTPCRSAASASTPSCPGRPTRRSPGRTETVVGLRHRLPRRGRRRRRRRPRSRPARSRSCAATPPSYVNGQTLITDAGYMSVGLTDVVPAAKPVVDFLSGNY